MHVDGERHCQGGDLWLPRARLGQQLRSLTQVFANNHFAGLDDQLVKSVSIMQRKAAAQLVVFVDGNEHAADDSIRKSI